MDDKLQRTLSDPEVATVPSIWRRLLSGFGKFILNIIGILGALISLCGFLLFLVSLGNRTEGAWVDSAGFAGAAGIILLVPGLIMLAVWRLIGKSISKPSDDNT